MKEPKVKTDVYEKIQLGQPFEGRVNYFKVPVGVYLKPEADRYINWIKHKRCLAMAEYCRSEIYTECTWHGNEQREEWFAKWEHRWLELAEKFKDAQ